MPASINSRWYAGSATAVRVACAICSMNSTGVPAGASSPIDPMTFIPTKPSSVAVGSSGAAMRRLGLVTARTRIFSDRWNSSTCAVTPGTPIGICPLTRSVMTGPVPR